MDDKKLELTKNNLLSYYDKKINYLKVNDPYRDLTDLKKTKEMLARAKNYMEIDNAVKSCDLIST